MFNVHAYKASLTLMLLSSFWLLVGNCCCLKEKAWLQTWRCPIQPPKAESPIALSLVGWFWPHIPETGAIVFDNTAVVMEKSFTGAFGGWFDIPEQKIELQRTSRLFLSHFPWPAHPKPQPQTWTGQHEKFIPAGILPYLGLSCQDKNCTPYPGQTLPSHSETITLHANIPPPIQQCLGKICAEDSGPPPRNKDELCVCFTSLPKRDEGAKCTRLRLDPYR